jgi:hypothetical protein
MSEETELANDKGRNADDEQQDRQTKHQVETPIQHS